MPRSVLTFSAAILISLLSAAIARAECFTLTAKYVMEQPVFELVFSGTVVEITRTSDLGYRATFDVDRVWKGSVSKRFDLYVWELEVERPKFVMGQHTVVLAQQIVTPKVRQGVGLGESDKVAFKPVQCSIAFPPEAIPDLGPAQAPK